MSSVSARGWKAAYRVVDADAGGPLELAFYCPECSRAEFGDQRRPLPPGE